MPILSAHRIGDARKSKTPSGSIHLWSGKLCQRGACYQQASFFIFNIPQSAESFKHLFAIPSVNTAPIFFKSPLK